MGWALIELTVQAVPVSVAMGDAPGGEPDGDVGEALDGAQPTVPAIATIDVTARTATRRMSLDDTCCSRAVGPPG
jgi:hypothetical protein